MGPAIDSSVIAPLLRVLSSGLLEPNLNSAVSPARFASRQPTLCGLGSLSRSPPVLLFLKSMFMVSVHASFCALSKIHIVVSVHARHPAHFLKSCMVWVTCSTSFPFSELALAPVTFGPHSTYASQTILLNRAWSLRKGLVYVCHLLGALSPGGQACASAWRDWISFPKVSTRTQR